ncbi:pancreatic triacylglycerol lipase isoform X1 [Stomoxys calcitrans]|uniref:pancreatic triacylglycerol lipase isoform X1 n=1 Tax=Stomoxys calcitrans TaxID=35570 RepID=UPI0027E33CA1|nr:pancreatic triacylglycerol lipase isoform X1 [Stomoxys calcitrans]
MNTNALYIVLQIGLYCSAIYRAGLSYKPGNCDISIFSVVQDMLRNEVRALLNPRLRYLASQQIHYDLYTTLNANERQILRTGDTKRLRGSYFNPKWPVRISIHGWAGKSTSCSNAAIKDAYLARGKYNVVLVDWSNISHDISYPRISQQFSEIAAHIAKFIRFLQKETGLEWSNIYLIGHSAGSHISGLTGKLLKPHEVGAIVALDPAGLAQLGLPADFRLAPNDAAYVESIHTDTTHLGNPSTELSHASFFPNWGQGQPHCPNATAAEFDFACDHFAALYYFAESVRQPKLFGAVEVTTPSCIKHHNCTCQHHHHQQQQSGTNECLADVYMGGEPLVPKHGVYYLSTRRNTPFGLEDIVRIRTSKRPNFLESSVLPYQLLLRG